MNLIPTVIESTGFGERAYDIYSKLLKERIVFIGGEITEALATSVTAQLLYLESQDPKADISIYINSPGGSVTAGMAIYDTMKFISCDVSTICVGVAASMGAFLLAGGTKGKRYSLPNAEIMIHQPLGQTGGQATDISIAAEHILKTRRKLYAMMADNTGNTSEQVAQDCERDNWLDPEDALAYGLIDKVVNNRK